MSSGARRLSRFLRLWLNHHVVMSFGFGIMLRDRAGWRAVRAGAEHPSLAVGG